jgi:hypothetical protein
LGAGSSENIAVTTVKLSELLSALSFVLDMVEGQPEGHVLRSCFIGMIIAGWLQLSEEQRWVLLYALVLKDAGCSSIAWKVTALFGADDFGVKKNLKTVNWSRLPRALLYIARNVSPEGAIGPRRGASSPQASKVRTPLASWCRSAASVGSRSYAVWAFPRRRPRLSATSTSTGTVRDSRTVSKCVEALEDLVSKGEL